MKTYFLNGSWNCDCDVCGLRFKSVDIVRRWDGAMTCKKCYEPRHPQDFIRVRDDRISVPFTRPENDIFVPQNTQVVFDEAITLLEVISTSAAFNRFIPNLGMFVEPLSPMSHALGLIKLNEETMGGTAVPDDAPEERITITEVLVAVLSSVASNKVLNGHKLNEVTLG